jgi:Fungal specific transcription factor domain
MYAVWPVVDRTALIVKLNENPNDVEIWALAYSVCAATGAQLRLDSAFGATSDLEDYSIIDRFAMEAERSRAMFDYKESATVNCILISFFLHMYYSSKKKRFTATLLLREALTLCELLDLDKEAMYATLDLEEQKFRRKVFWLLFITERGNAMQYDAAALLRNTIALPIPEDDRDPVLFAAFLSLVHLFVAVEGTLVGSGANGGQTFSTELFSQLQQRLRDSPTMPPHSSELQKTDICVTQQWFLGPLLRRKWHL